MPPVWVFTSCDVPFTTIDDSSRHIGYNTAGYGCVNTFFQPGEWYTFQDAQGFNSIPEKAPSSVNQCGTQAPGWMSGGAHPTPEEGIVARTICYFWCVHGSAQRQHACMRKHMRCVHALHASHKCAVADAPCAPRRSGDRCLWSSSASVKQCEGRYLYQIAQVPFCNLRVCTTNVPPASLWSGPPAPPAPPRPPVAAVSFYELMDDTRDYGYYSYNSPEPSACPAWTSFQASISASSVYSRITVYGSNNAAGVSCRGAAADRLCQALRVGAPVAGADVAAGASGEGAFLQCDGFSWGVTQCGNGWGITAGPSLNDVDSCSCLGSASVEVRPCIGNGNPNWGGINTGSCNAPEQYLGVSCGV